MSGVADQDGGLVAEVVFEHACQNHDSLAFAGELFGAHPAGVVDADDHVGCGTDREEVRDDERWCLDDPASEV